MSGVLGGRRVLANINTLVDKARGEDMPVVHRRHGHLDVRRLSWVSERVD